MGVGQALSVPIVDPSRYQTPLMGAVGTRKGMSSTLSWVLWWFGWYISAGLPVVWVERDFSGTYHAISIFHIFYHLCSKYYHLPTFTHHVYLRVGDIERAWLTRSVVSKTLIHFDFYTFLADTRTTIYIGLSCSLLFYIVTREYLCSDLSMVSLYISIHLHGIFLIYTGQWQYIYNVERPE